MQESDSALLQQWVARRDAEAMAAIVHRHAGMVYATCKRILGNASEAEDAAQESFIRLASVRHAGPSLAGLLHTIATHQCVNRIRSESRRRARESAYAAGLDETTEIGWDDVQQYVDEAIGELPEKHRQAVVRHFMEGQTHTAIAAELGVSRAAVSHRIQRGIKQIRKGLLRRGVPVALPGLAALLATHAAGEEPATLTARLAKLAIAGTRNAPPAVPLTSSRGAASFLKGMTIMKAAGILGVVVGAVMLGMTLTPSGGVTTASQGGKVQPQLIVAAAEELEAPAEETETAAAPVAQGVETAPAETRTVTGTVRSDTGYPRPSVHFVPAEDRYLIFRGAESDIEGKFELTEVKPEQTQWYAYSQNTQRAALFTLAEDSDYADVVLDMGLMNVLGRVVDASGKGVPKTQVGARLVSPSGEVFDMGALTADIHGYYELHEFPTAGGYTLQVRVQPPAGEVPDPWSEPYPLALNRYHLEIPPITVSNETAADIEKNQSIDDLTNCNLAALAQAKPRERFGGLVRDTAGRPVEGARVEMTYTVKQGILNTAVSQTDAQGRWSRLVPEGLARVSVMVEHPDMAWFHQDIPVERLREQTSIIEVERGVRVSGVVRDDCGRGVPDAIVAVTDALKSYTAGGPEVTAGMPVEDMSCTRTDVDGAFHIATLAPGEQTLEVLQFGYAPAAVTFDAAHGMAPLEIQLDEGGVITGRFVDPRGNPLPTAYVYGNAWYPGKPYRTGYKLHAGAHADENGFFRLAHVPLNAKLRFRFGAEGADRGRFYSMSTETMVPRDEPYEIVMYPRAVVTGTVVDDETGAPVTEFTVRGGVKWGGKDDHIFWTTMGSAPRVQSPDGAFEKTIDGISLGYPVESLYAAGIIADGYLPAQSALFRFDETPVPVEIRLRRGTPIEGVVVDGDGAPVAGVTVAWIGRGESALVQNGRIEVHTSSTPNAVRETGPDGGFSLPPSEEPGEILALHNTGYARCPIGDLPKSGELVLTSWARIEGVIYHTGQPPEGAQVSVLEPGGNAWGSEKTPVRWTVYQSPATDGSFVFTHVPAIPLLVGESFRGKRSYGLSRTAYCEPAPGEALFVEIAAEPCSVRGVFIFAPESPVQRLEEGHWILGEAWPANGAPAPVYALLVDETGGFQITDMAPGEYELDVRLQAWDADSGQTIVLSHAFARFTVPGEDGSEAVDLGEVLLVPGPGER